MLVPDGNWESSLIGTIIDQSGQQIDSAVSTIASKLSPITIYVITIKAYIHTEAFQMQCMCMVDLEAWIQVHKLCTVHSVVSSCSNIEKQKLVPLDQSGCVYKNNY